MSFIADPRSMPGALIVGGAHVSLAIARSLGRRGIRVWLMANHPLPRYSRYVERSFDWPGADHPDALSSIVDVVTDHKLNGWVLIATGDQDMAMIARHRAMLAAHLRVPTADWQTIRWAYDKHLTYERAEALGIDTPRDIRLRGIDELARLDCRFPVVLKPATRNGEDEFTLAKAWRADDLAALLELYPRAAALVGADAVIMQEWIPGAGETQFSYAGLWNDGVPVASLVARRTRQHPIDFGRSSSFVEIVERPEVREIAERFLASINYSGVTEIEFKQDPRDGRYRLLDVNGRFWTWCGLADAAGIDFPYLLYRQALGLPVVAGQATPGMAWMHVTRDILAAALEMQRGTTGVGGYLSGLTRVRSFASFAADDPLPAVAEIPSAVVKRIAGSL